MNFLKKLFLFSFFATGLLFGLIFLISPFLFYGDEDFNLFILIIFFFIGALFTFYSYKGSIHTKAIEKIGQKLAVIFIEKILN